MSDELICEGPIRRQHLETILQEYFKTTHKLTKATGEVISKGLGFTSDVMRVELEWDVKNGLPSRVIAKAPKIENVASLFEKFGGEPGQEATDQSAQMVTFIHERECVAYNLLKSDPPLPIPLIYGYWLVTDKLPGLIVMEDLGARAGLIDNIADGLTLDQWRNILLGLADLHAWSLKSNTWQSHVPDVKSMEEMFKGFSLMSNPQLKKNIEKYPEYFSHIDVEKSVEMMQFDKLMTMNTMHRDFMPDVLQHGDTWINNIMFEKDENGKITDKVAAFIDWQICLSGGCINDMARLTSMCVNHEMRRAHQYELLRCYYDRLKSKSGDILKASFDQIKTLYDNQLAMNGLFGAMMVDFMLANIAKVDEDGSGGRQLELLQRAKAGYDDAAAFFGWKSKPNAKDLICDGPITKQHVESILQEYFKTTHKITKAKGEVISKGLGFTSDVMRVDLEWDVKDGLPSRVIAKAPKIENIAVLMEKFGGETGQNAVDQSAQFVPMIHERECVAYKILNPNPPVPMPLIYGYWLVTDKLPGLIVMEDLGQRAGLIDNIADGLTLDQWRNIVIGLADLHAWSLRTDAWRQHVPDVTSMADFFKSVTQMADVQTKQMKAKYPDYFAHVDVEKIVQKLKFEEMMELNTKHRSFMPDVLQHGDTWINNIMFEKDENGKITDKVAAFIDWQICLSGCCVSDFARLNSWCVNHDMRRNHEYEILRDYYDRLKAKSGDKLTASFDQIKDLYVNHVSLHGLFGTFMVDFMLENIAKADEDETGFRKRELLMRAKAGYDDAVKFYGWSSKANVDDLICDGPITKQHVENMLQDYFKTSTKLKSASGVVISKGLGFTSDVMRVDLEWDVKDGLPSRVIAKAPKIEHLTSLMDKFNGPDTTAQFAKFVPIIHETECKAYKMLGDNPPLPVPKVYGCCLVTDTKPGLIVMEDMGARAGLIDNIATGLSLNQWRNCLNCLADLHAWSMTTDVPWRDQVTDITTMSDFFKSFQQNAPTQIKMLKETYPEYFSHVDEENVIKEMVFENLMEKNTKYKTVMQDVLQHGDTWLNNILFEKKEDGTLTDNVAAFIDWQICMKGSIANDVARLSSWCVNHEIRRTHEMELLKHYYDRLISKSGGKLTVTFEQVKDLYQTLMALNGVMGVIMVDMMLHMVGKVDEDKTGWRKKELLQRTQALYDDAVKFYGWQS